MISRRPRPPQPHFFLGREDNVDLGIGLLFPKPAQSLDSKPACDAIVQRLGDNLVPHLEEGFIHHDHVADFHNVLRFRAKAGVDEEFMGFRNLFPILGRGDVHRTAAGVHDRFKIALVGAHNNPAGEQVSWIEPSDRL